MYKRQATGAAIGSTLQAFANPAGQAAAEGSGTPTVTVEKLRAKRKRYRALITKNIKPLLGGRGVFRQAAALYESVKGSDPSPFPEVAIPDALKEGEQLVNELERRTGGIEAWTHRTVSSKSAECDDLLDQLSDLTERIASDLVVCERQIAREMRRSVKWLGIGAGDLTDVREGILKPVLDDPSAFVEKGVVKDPVEFTQDDVNTCVLFGWHGVLNNADM